jgi:hypothetical protein
MVARIGFSATTSREPRQARKGAAAAAMSGAGARLVRAASFGARLAARAGMNLYGSNGGATRRRDK